MNKFWFVWCEQLSPPRFKHETEVSAMNEAERLSKEFRGKKFIVLESKCDVQVTEVQWTQHKQQPDEIPF